jgi:hypothetical protein
MENAGFMMIDPDDGMKMMFVHSIAPLLVLLSGQCMASADLRRPGAPKGLKKDEPTVGAILAYLHLIQSTENAVLQVR